MTPFSIFPGSPSDAAASAPISSLLIKPASAVCNLDCSYCFYLDREADPYKDVPARVMTKATLERLVASYLEYSYPEAQFAFQGGEPTLAGLGFYEDVVRLQQKHGIPGHGIGNSIQTNGVLLTRDWCELFREYNFLVGLSLDGPGELHDKYRINKAGRGSFDSVVRALELLKASAVEFNVLCVVSDANVERATETYRFFRSLGVEHMQFIPLAEFAPDGTPQTQSISGESYGRFLCELFDQWWPERRTVRVRHFDNIAEAVAGIKPGTCTMHDSCDSYAVVEYNGDVYPCDFFVEPEWKLGNVVSDDWPELAQRLRRAEFAAKKRVPHAACSGVQLSGPVPRRLPQAAPRAARTVRGPGLVLLIL